MIQLTPEDISKIINLAIASLQVKSLKIPHMSLRPNIHIIMYGSVGSTKSTILYNVSKNLKGNVIKGLTKANLYGIVDKDGDVIPPTIWDCFGSFLFIDEYHISGSDRHAKDLLNSLLSDMENPEYDKKISFKARPFNEGDKKFYCKVEKGRLKVRTRFGLFLNTMMPITSLDINEVRALCSRCLCIPIFPTEQDLEKIADGYHLYVFDDIKVKRENVVIKKEAYDAIKGFVKAAGVSKEHYLRRIGDLCRAFAVLGKIDEEVFNLILSLP